MRFKAVIGCGFGDEGKGMTVDYLCSQSPEALVVRFNGGHQAGHTVVTDQTRHVFSNLGSGTLRGIPTYWSKNCTVEPFGLLNELSILLTKCKEPKLYIDAECPITTPYDIKNNRFLEFKNNHGSCGVGFGETINRENAFYSLKFLDLFYPNVLETKLSAIKTYYKSKQDYDKFFTICQELASCEHVQLVFNRPNAGTYIFEGAQGLLLDQHYGFFPNVTRSNCGSANLPNENFEYFLVTRAYQTRHGNGFMTNTNIPQNILFNPDETNLTHPYQGVFRRAILDVDLLEYAIKKDKYIRESAHKNLVISCIDHLQEYKYTYKGNLKEFKNKESFIESIGEVLNIKKLFFNENSNSKYMQKVM